MSDDLRDALSAAFDEVEEAGDAGQGDAPERVEIEAQEGADETEAQRAERARDEAGRFAKETDKVDGKDKPREKLTLKPKEAKDAAQKPERQEEGQDPAAKAGVVEQVAKVGDVQHQPRAGDQPVLPPANWNGNSKVSWEKLPYPVKQAIAADYEQMAPLRSVAPVIQQAAPMLMQRYGDVSHGLGSVLQLYHSAVTSPLDFVRGFCQQFNIDPGSLGGAAQADVHGEAPQPWQQELAEVKGQLQALVQQPLIAQQNQIQTEVQAFGGAVNQDGTLAHPYYNDVRPIMAALFQAGKAKTLQEAYDQACYADPAIRQTLMAVREQQQAAERRKAADTARQASASVAGAPGHRGPGQPQNETVSASLSRVIEQLSDRRA